MAVTRADGVHFDAKDAGADLSEAINLIVKYDTDNRMVLAGNGEYPAGIVTEGATEDNPVTFQTGGLGKCKAGAAINAGQRVMSNGDSKAIPVSGASSISLGVARSSVTAEDEVVEVEIDRTRGA